MASLFTHLNSLIIVLPTFVLVSCIESNPDFIENFNEGGGLITGGEAPPLTGGETGGIKVAGIEAGTPAGIEAGTPAGIEAGTPAGIEAGTPAGIEAGTPAGIEAGTPAGIEAGTPAGIEAGTPAGIEAGTPAGMEGGTPILIDQDRDGAPSDVDCDDSDPNRAPGFEELCDGIDNNCNQQVDEAFVGLGERCLYEQVGVCEAWSTFVCAPNAQQLLCNPVPSITISEEVCDQMDNDCDGLIDEDDVCVVICVSSPEQCDQIDNDCDGLVDEGLTAQCACGQPEQCNGADDDCDGQVDESLSELCIVEIAESALGDPNAYLGSVLLNAGDLNGDGYQDIIVSAMGDALSNLDNINSNQVGTVYALHGQTGAILWQTSGTGAFGASLALGDFNRDGIQELAIGAPRQNVSNDRGLVQIVAYQGDTLAVLTSPNRRDVELGTSLLTIETPDETRLIVGEPRYRNQNSNTERGRIRALSFNEGWDNPFTHSLIIGDFSHQRLGERLHKIPNLAGGSIPNIITTFKTNGQRGTWLVNDTGQINDASTLMPPNPSLTFGNHFLWYKLDGLVEYAITDSQANQGQGALYWFNPLTGGTLGNFPTPDTTGFGQALATIPNLSGGLLFVSATGSNHVYIARSLSDVTRIEDVQITGGHSTFGDALSASEAPCTDGTYRLFIGIPGASDNRGKVKVYSVR